MFPMTTSTMYNAFKPTRMPLVTANVPNALHRGDSYCLARRVPETMQVKTFLRRHFHRTHRLSRRADATAAASRPSDVFSMSCEDGLDLLCFTDVVTLPPSSFDRGPDLRHALLPRPCRKPQPE